MYFQFQAILRRATGRLPVHNKAQHCLQMEACWGLNWTGLYRLPQLRGPSPFLLPSRKQVDYRLTSLSQERWSSRKKCGLLARVGLEIGDQFCESSTRSTGFNVS